MASGQGPGRNHIGIDNKAGPGVVSGKIHKEVPGIATPEDVDKAVKLGLNYPMGPFELMDLTGIDIAKYVADYFYNELNKENKWVAPTLLKNMIRAGRLGRKTGAGWYEYKK